MQIISFFSKLRSISALPTMLLVLKVLAQSYDCLNTRGPARAKCAVNTTQKQDVSSDWCSMLTWTLNQIQNKSQQPQESKICGHEPGVSQIRSIQDTLELRDKATSSQALSLQLREEDARGRLLARWLHYDFHCCTQDRRNACLCLKFMATWNKRRARDHGQMPIGTSHGSVCVFLVAERNRRYVSSAQLRRKRRVQDQFRSCRLYSQSRASGAVVT
ncbi:hypothetical protein SELMODRAFT_410720 [Selaginella moellendorffii]|uniref:Secreted protein n=1 Tax=Selaginella moellendorffii TaxID=88036 RepID=D8RFN4_SELML|nr:hypothetical protein SELMODRAFT_410720 [Selaginella moellendorffii]